MRITKKWGGYIAATFRFQNLIGDFPETNFAPLDKNDAELLMEKCRNALIKLYRDTQKTILITSDSITFLRSCRKYGFIRYVDMELSHPEGDTAVNQIMDSYLKSFIDLMMLSKADHCYSIYTDLMYKGSQFAKTASIIGGKLHNDIYLD